MTPQAFAQNAVPARRPAQAAPAPSPAPANKGPVAVDAVVKPELAQVYATPDFDGAVIGTIPGNTTVRVSKGTAGSFAKFHKVRVNGKVGYIADIDVRIAGAVSMKKKSGKKVAKNGKKEKTKDEKKPEKPKEHVPIFFARFVGFTLGATFYKESISNVDSKQTLATYGLKITGPDVFFKGPVIDADLLLHYGAPSYYGPLSTTQPSGFLLFVDTLLMVPLLNREDWMVYASSGPMLAFTDFSVSTSSKGQLSLMALDFGWVFDVGVAFRIEKAAVRIEGRYDIEKNSYPVVQASVQQEF